MTELLSPSQVQDWSRRFQLVGLKVMELTGDSGADEMRQINQSHIIVSTPEKWDSITRRWKEYLYLLGKVGPCAQSSMNDTPLINLDTDLTPLLLPSPFHGSDPAVAD